MTTYALDTYEITYADWSVDGTGYESLIQVCPPLLNVGAAFAYAEQMVAMKLAVDPGEVGIYRVRDLYYGEDVYRSEQCEEDLRFDAASGE